MSMRAQNCIEQAHIQRLLFFQSLLLLQKRLAIQPRNRSRREASRNKVGRAFTRPSLSALERSRIEREGLTMTREEIRRRAEESQRRIALAAVTAAYAKFNDQKERQAADDRSEEKL